MKKQETNPGRDQYRSSDKNQTPNKSTKTKPQVEERTGKKTFLEQEDHEEADYAVVDDQRPQKESSRKPARDLKN
jgi:hypothetical protein